METGLKTGLSVGSTPVSMKNELSQQQQYEGSTIKLIGMGIGGIAEADIKLLESMERISMRKNLISNLPSNFCCLKSLRYLDLDSNMLREIPTVLMQCPTLEILDLSNNRIESLPGEITKLWSKNLKVLSLKNNNVGSIWAMSSLAKLENLSVLEIEGNPLPKEELDLVMAYTPMTSGIAQEEYWAVALRRYLQSQTPPTLSTSGNNNDPKMTRAAKRMGFISTTTTSDHSTPVSPSPVSQVFSSDGEFSSISHNDTSTTSNNELYNHSKFNDYFKRLSILPEESYQNTNGEQSSAISSSNEQHRLSHEELVIACRKLLFGFTECQQNIRKIASFCKEKSVAVSVVSLLYSVRSHIDNLVEVLEQAESKEDSHDKALIKLCMTIVSIFKQIIGQLRRNFKAFFEGDDLCFIRMFYMTLLCSYNEIYNAWCFLGAEDAKFSKKRSVGSRSLSSSKPPPSFGTNGTNSSGVFLPRTRSNTLQSNVVPMSFNTGVDSINITNNIVSPVPGTVTPPYPLGVQQSSRQMTPPPALSSSSASINPNNNNDNNDNNNNSNNNSSLPVPQNSQVSTEPRHSPRQYTPHSPKPKASENIGEPESESPSASVSSASKNVDQQLYQTLRVVIKMVNVVYDQLTSMISKTARESTSGQQELTANLLTKIRDLTDTCCQAMDLSKALGERLNLLMSEMVGSEKFLTHGEKLKTWENINAFLKSIISILANAKILMEGMPALNEIRPNLASLAKVTKDVTVILDLSSYKGVSVLASQTQPQQPQHQHQQQYQQHQYQHQQHPYYQHVPSHQHGYHQQHVHQYPQQYPHDEHMHIPMMTPQATSAHAKNPFEDL